MTRSSIPTLASDLRVVEKIITMNGTISGSLIDVTYTKIIPDIYDIKYRQNKNRPHGSFSLSWNYF